VRGIDPKVVWLRQVPGLAEVSDRALSTVAPLVDEVTVASGTAVTREGERAHEVAMVLEGHATVSAGGAVLGTVGPGEFIGDTAFLSGQPHETTVLAATSLRLLVAGPESSRSLLRHPLVAPRLRPGIASR